MLKHPVLSLCEVSVFVADDVSCKDSDAEASGQTQTESCQLLNDGQLSPIQFDNTLFLNKSYKATSVEGKGIS